jgi:hypothetical protein
MPPKPPLPGLDPPEEVPGVLPPEDVQSLAELQLGVVLPPKPPTPLEQESPPTLQLGTLEVLPPLPPPLPLLTLALQATTGKAVAPPATAIRKRRSFQFMA